MGVDYEIYLGPYAEITVSKIEKGNGKWCSNCKQQQLGVDKYCSLCGDELEGATKEEYATAWDIVPDEYEDELTVPLAEGYDGPIATFIANDSSRHLEWCNSYQITEDIDRAIEQFKKDKEDVFGAIIAKEECLSIEYKYGAIPYMH